MVKHILLIAATCAALYGCGDEGRTYDNNCTSDSWFSTYQGDVACLEPLADSLRYELTILEQKFHYECRKDSAFTPVKIKNPCLSTGILTTSHWKVSCLKPFIDSLRFEMKMLQQKVHYECSTECTGR